MANVAKLSFIIETVGIIKSYGIANLYDQRIICLDCD